MKYLLELDSKLHRKVKIVAATNDTTIREIIIELLENYVDTEFYKTFEKE